MRAKVEHPAPKVEAFHEIVARNALNVRSSRFIARPLEK